jgi:Holliday junction resolvase-like predicted endonuclease
MASTRAKGKYQLKRTREWLKSLGYEVETCEVSYSRLVGGRWMFRTKDLWGADLIARNHNNLIFIQVKGNKGHMKHGERQLSVDSNWPDNDTVVQRWVVHWPKYRQTTAGPEIRIVNGKTGDSKRSS